MADTSVQRAPCSLCTAQSPELQAVSQSCCLDGLDNNVEIYWSTLGASTAAEVPVAVPSLAYGCSVLIGRCLIAALDDIRSACCHTYAQHMWMVSRPASAAGVNLRAECVSCLSLSIVAPLATHHAHVRRPLHMHAAASLLRRCASRCRRLLGDK